MKWINKGHEFDSLGERLQNYTSVYFFGAGVHGKTAFDKYRNKINIKGFLDNDLSKHNHGFCGLPVFSPADICLSGDEAVVITTQPFYADDIKTQLAALNITEVFSMQVFFPILDAYQFGETCLSSISFLPTTVCNLKCRHCLNFSPYIKEHQVRPLEQLVKDLDLLFSKIDTLLLLHLSGGEPFTYPYLAELLDYITHHYKDKLGRLEMTTNGTVVPSGRLLASMKHAELYLTVDDYRDVLPRHRDRQDEILRLLNEFGISYRILKADTWIDLAPFENPEKQMDEEELCKHFNRCSVPWQEYRDGKLWLCNYAAYAEIAGIQRTGNYEYFDIAAFRSENCRELAEFRLGYSENGYTEFCKRCHGFNNNLKAVPPAVQLS